MGISARAAALHTALVGELVTTGRVRSPAVQAALRTVPRHLFLPGVELEAAYADDAVAVQHVDGVPTSSASQPSMVAIMLEQLALRPGDRVLEIGAGTGWNAALMTRIVGPDGEVTSIDIDEELVASAQAHLGSAGIEGVRLLCGDGTLGVPDGAPYDRIVLTVGSADVWPAWLDQLAPGGRLLLPMGVRGTQLSVAFDLGPDGILRSDSARSCGFIRLRGPGESADPAVAIPGGATVVLPGDADPAGTPGAASCRIAFRGPGELLPAPVGLGPADLWDGFGLWLTLTEPGAGRVIARRGAALPGPRREDVVRTLPMPVTTPASPDAPTVPDPPGGAAVAAVPGSEAAADPAREVVPGAEPAPESAPPRVETAAGVTAESTGTGLVLISAVETEPGAAMIDVPVVPGPVAVRVFGPAGPRLAARMLAALDDWAAAGHPAAPAWRITAVPAGAAVDRGGPAAGVAVVVHKPQCRLVLTCPPA